MGLDQQLKEHCWQDMERSKKLKKIVNDKIFSDCEFLVGPEDSTAEIINGHKLMFIMESPVFENMMTGSLIEGRENQIRIIDAHPDDFKNFCDLIYNNDYNKYSTLSLSQVFALYRIADKYLVSSISGDCIKYMMSIINGYLEMRKLLMLFEFAVEIGDRNLQTYVEKEISSRQAVTMFNEKINDFSFDLFYEYILFISKLPSHSNQYDRKFMEAQKAKFIFDAVETYIKFNNLLTHGDDKKIKELEEVFEKDAIQKKTDLDKFEDKNMTDKNNTETEKYEKGKSIVLESKNERMFNIFKLKRKLLKLIKFDEMTVDDFVNGPGKSDLLELDEKYKLLTHLCANNKK